LVVLRQPGDLRLRCRKSLFQLPDMPRALGQFAPHQGEFLLKKRDLGGEIVGVLLPTCGARLRVVTSCHVPPPRGLERCALTLTAARHGSPLPAPPSQNLIVRGTFGWREARNCRRRRDGRYRATRGVGRPGLVYRRRPLCAVCPGSL